MFDNGIIKLGSWKIKGGKKVFIEDEEKTENYRDHVINPDKIPSETDIQESEKNKGIHSHTLLEITLRDCIAHVDRQAIVDYIAENMHDVQNAYVNIKVIKGAAKYILQYIRRDEQLEEGQLADAFKKLDFK